LNGCFASSYRSRVFFRASRRSQLFISALRRSYEVMMPPKKSVVTFLDLQG